MSAYIPAPDAPDVVYLGDFPGFAAARAECTGYEAAVITERTRVSLHKVLRGEAAYERDSVAFDKLEPPFPLLAHLLRAAAARGGRLSVLDFGGALGSTYFLCRQFLREVPQLEWSIVDLPANVDCGRREFADGVLRFYPSIVDCLRERDPQVLLLSSVLQYLPEPWALLREAAARPYDWIILDRTAFIDAPRDRLTVEHVHPRIYPASYPAWFFSRPRLESNLPPGWRIETEFDALDRQLLDGREIVFKGFALRRHP